MKYSELLDSGAAAGELQSFLVGGDVVPVSMRIPENLRDAAKEAAELSGMSFTSYVKMCLIERLLERGH
ncbi:MAG: BrnA antitoxin family protein [Clostridiales bacterium]|nr:BrnA antitoxin family protein [Clostridiales bacterium]